MHEEELTSPYDPGVGQDIAIYTGSAVLFMDGIQTDVQIESSITFSPRPRMIVGVKGEFQGGAPHIPLGFGRDDFEIHIPAANEFYSLNLKNSVNNHPHFEATFIGDRCLHQKSNVSMESVRFHLANFPDFFWRSAGRGPQPAIVVDFGSWILRIEPSHRRNDERETAKEERSFLITNIGEIRRSDGALFSPSDYEPVENFLMHLLPLLSGGFCGPFLEEGLDCHHNVVWRNQRPIMLSRAKPSFNWFPRPFPEDIGKLIQSAWDRWNNPVRQEALRRAIDWYRQITDTEMIAETHIVLCQTTLELLSHIVVSEEGNQQLRRQFQNLGTTKEKIELLADCIQANKQIPSHFSELTQTSATYRWSTAPAALVGIRNKIIHPQLRNRRVYVAIDLDSKIQICRWCIWLVELSILYMLGYSGRYDSRIATDGMGFPLVPWIDPTQAPGPCR